MIGEVFGLNVVTEDLGMVPYGNQGRTCHKVRVKCLGCNTKRVVHTDSLTSGKSTKCDDCRKLESKERIETHGFYTGIPRTKEGQSLIDAIKRCISSKRHNYMRYGGRGIKVCERWLGPDGYINFLADMGPCPPGLTLERKDYNDGYHPDNCVWATLKVQSRNKSNNRQIEIDGVTLNLCEWSECSGVKSGTIQIRLTRGWSPIEAVFRKPHCLGIPSDTKLKLAFINQRPTRQARRQLRQR